MDKSEDYRNQFKQETRWDWEEHPQKYAQWLERKLRVLKNNKDGRYYNVGGEICDNCNKIYKTIYNAPDELWAEITGNSDGSGLLCIGCFDMLASLKGYKLLWKPKVHEVFE